MYVCMYVFTKHINQYITFHHYYTDVELLSSSSKQNNCWQNNYSTWQKHKLFLRNTLCLVLSVEICNLLQLNCFCFAQLIIMFLINILNRKVSQEDTSRVCRQASLILMAFLIQFSVRCFNNIHTYIIDHQNPSMRIIGLVSHTTYVGYVNFIHKWRGTYSLKSTPKDKFFEKLFMAVLIYSQSFCQKSAERKSPKKYFLYFVLISGLGLESWLYL